MKFNRSLRALRASALQVTWYSKLLALILFVALPFLGFYAGMKYQQAIAPPSQEVPNGTKPNGSDQTGWKTIVDSDQVTVKTKYEAGVLKYSGTVQLPTPCHKLKEESLVMESYPEQVQIRLTIQDPGPGTFCAQVITQKEFSGQVQVSEKAVVSVYLNGEKVE